MSMLEPGLRVSLNLMFRSRVISDKSVSLHFGSPALLQACATGGEAHQPGSAVDKVLASGSYVHQAGSELVVDQESSQQIFGKPDPVSRLDACAQARIEQEVVQDSRNQQRALEGCVESSVA